MSTPAERPIQRDPVQHDPDAGRVGVRVLVPDDWDLLRRARLEALADTPDAFLSRQADLERWFEDDWRRQFHGRVWAVGTITNEVVGVAGSVGFGDRLRTRHLESVWVAPAYRLHGIARRLVETLIHHERRRGVTEILVWVFADNGGAREVYEHLGFIPTGERQPVGEPPVRTEERLRLALGSGPA